MDQNFSDVVMECNNCHLEFYAQNLHVQPESNLLICVNCLRLPGSKINILQDRPLKKKQAEVKQAPIQRMTVPAKREQTRKIEVPEGYSLYKCNACHYEFRRKNGFTSPCPYCCKKGGLALIRAN